MRGTAFEEDFGRLRETKELAEGYAFRTPSLINAALTGHSGAYGTLKQIICHHLSPQESVNTYFANDGLCQQLSQLAGQFCLDIYPFGQTNTQAALDHLAGLRATNESLLEDIQLTELQINRLVSFIETLTLPVRSCVLRRR